MPEKGRTSSAKCIFKKEKDSSNQRGSHIFGQIIFSGAEERFFSKGAPIKRKMRFCLFPKILLNKSLILRGAPDDIYSSI